MIFRNVVVGANLDRKNTFLKEVSGKRNWQKYALIEILTLNPAKNFRDIIYCCQDPGPEEHMLDFSLRPKHKVYQKGKMIISNPNIFIHLFNEQNEHAQWTNLWRCFGKLVCKRLDNGRFTQKSGKVKRVYIATTSLKKCVYPAAYSNVSGVSIAENFVSQRLVQRYRAQTAWITVFSQHSCETTELQKQVVKNLRLPDNNRTEASLPQHVHR